jgi:hypothetical protein
MRRKSLRAAEHALDGVAMAIKVWGEATERLNGGTIYLPSRMKDRPDRDRLALRFERFKAVA